MFGREPVASGVDVPVRDLTAEARARWNRRSISTGPSPVLAVAVARADSTAWAAAPPRLRGRTPLEHRGIFHDAPLTSSPGPSTDGDIKPAPRPATTPGKPS